MNTPLQQAAKALINRWDLPAWKDQPHTAHYVAELRKALDAELVQSVEPVAWTLTKTIDARETTTTAYLWFVNPINTSWTPLYLHQPQPQATTPSIRQHCRECANWAKAVADTKEWADGVKIGREIIKKLAAAQGEKP